MAADEMIIVRQMSEEDIDQVWALEKECFSMPWSRESFQDMLSNPDALFLLAFYDGSCAGYCGCLCSLDEAYVANVAVKKDLRRMGIGYRMLKGLIEQLKERGITSIALEVRSGNREAIWLYDKLGFETAGFTPGMYEMPREDAAVMVLKLA